MANSLRKDLAATTFEDLLKMKDKLGTKIYRENVLKKMQKPNEDGTDDTDDESNKSEIEDDDDDDYEEKLRINKKNQIRKNFQFERTNKGYPIEATSKTIDNRYDFSIKPVICKEELLKKSNQPCDPRFDNNCGVFQNKYFEKNYSFLTKMKQDELELLRKQLKKSNNEQTKKRLQFLIQRLCNQLKCDEDKLNGKQIQLNVKKRISSVKQIEINKQKPLHVNKATMKRSQLVEKYRQLKESGKLNKYIERKRKKNAAKDRRLINKKI